MGELNIKDYSEVKHNDWNEYVYNHKNGNIFQTLMYLNMHNKSFGAIPFGFALCDDDRIVGVVAGVIYQNYFFPINILTKRAVIIGGPLTDNDNAELIERLIRETDTFLKRKVVYIQFRNITDLSGQKEVFEKTGFFYEEHLDIIHHLDQDVDAIKKGISKNKRNNVVKAQNRGAEFVEVFDKEEYASAVSLVFDTYKRVGLPCPTKEFFVNAFTLFPEIVKAFAVKFESQIIGFRLELCYKNMVYDWYAGYDERHKNCYPNDVLPYNILFWAKENNYKTFDFGGAGKPNVPYGVREHKLKFGGELVCFGRFEKVKNSLIYNTLKGVLRLSKIIKKR